MGGSVSRQNLVDMVNRNMTVASDPGKKPGRRCSALAKLEQMCHIQPNGIGATCQSVLSEVHHLGKLLEIISSDNKLVARGAWQALVTVTYTTDREIKLTVGRRVLEDLMEELLRFETLDAADLQLIVTLVSHLSSEDACRQQVHRGVRRGGRGGVPELIGLLNHPDPNVQIASLEALVALSEMRAVRQQILDNGGLLPIVGLSFVGTLYGQTRHYAIRLLANLTKEYEVRVRLAEQAVLYRLAQACRKAHGTIEPALLLLVASVFCNFSTHDDLGAVQPEDTMGMLYQLVFSDEIEFVIQGLWAIANYLGDPGMRRQFIETDGMKLLFSVLGEANGECQIWFEVARAILAISSGGNRTKLGGMVSGAAGDDTKAGAGNIASEDAQLTGEDEEKEFLVREGALEALVAIYAWCMEDKKTKTKPAGEDIKTGPVELDEVPPEEQGSVYDIDGEDIERSARYLCMTVVTQALKHLTSFGFVCQMLCDRGGTKAVMQVLRADFDTEGQEHAAAVIGNIARHPEPCRVVVLDDDAVGSLVDLLKYSTHELVHLQASFALANIAKMSGHYQKIIIESGGVTGLITVLKRGCPDKTKKNIIRALSLLSTNEAKFEMMHAGGLPHIIKASQEKDIDLRLFCAAALRNLCEMADDSHHLVMVKEGVFTPLVRQLNESNQEMNREAARAIAILTSRMESNKVALVEQDGLRAVAKHLASDDDEVLVQVLSILGNLGTVAGIMAEMNKNPTIIRQLCYVLRMDKFSLTLQAMKCLVNSTTDEKESAIVLQLVPAQIFVDMLDSPNATLQRHSSHVLANLALNQCNWFDLRKVHLIKVLTKQMRSDNFDVVIQAVRCIAYMTQDKESALDMERYSMATVLSEVAKKSVDVLLNEDRDDDLGSYVSARNLRMQEQVMTAMRLMSKTPASAIALVEEHDCLEVFLRLLEVPSIDVRRETAGCLANISALPFLCERLVEEGGMDRIMTCLDTSVNITKGLVEGLKHIRQRLQEDSEEKEKIKVSKKAAGAFGPGGGSTGIEYLSAELQKAGLSFEEREHLMNQMDRKVQFSNQNAELQKYCLECMYHFSQEDENQRALLEAYDWDSFMAPLHLPEECQVTDCLIMASKTCFTMLHCKLKLYRFMELDGVSNVLKALEYDDADVKYLAAEALGILSNADQFAFQRAIEQVGGVKSIMRLTESMHRKIRAQAFHAVAQLCNNKELGAMFVAQNILQSLSAYSNKVKHQPQTLCRLIQIVSSLADNEKNRWKVLEKGGTTLLLKSIAHYDLNVAKAAGQTLHKLVSVSDVDLREGVTRNKMAPNLLGCIELCPFAEALRDVLATMALVTEREAYREKVMSNELLEVILKLCDSEDRDRCLRERATKNDRRRQEEIAHFKKSQEQDEQRYKQQSKEQQLTVGGDGGGALDQDDEEDVEDGDNQQGRAGRDVLEMLSAYALQCVSNFLLIPRAIDHVLSSDDSLRYLIKAANPLASPLRLHMATKALCQCLQRRECHRRVVDLNVLGKFGQLAKTENVDAKKEVAEAFRLLSANPDIRPFFEDNTCVDGLKELASSRMREVQISTSASLRDLTQTPVVAKLFARKHIMAELLDFLEQEQDALKIDSMQTIRQLCPCYHHWCEHPDPEFDDQAATNECGPSISKIMNVYRLSLQRSVLGNMALQTLCSVLWVCPENLCPLVDQTPGAVLELKKAALQRSREAGRGVTYTGELGKSSCDLHAYIKTGGDLAGQLVSAEPRVNAARALCYMTQLSHELYPGGGPRVAVLKALSAHDIVGTAADEANDTCDVRYLVLLLRMVGNCVQRPTQRHKLADDKTGLLKVLLDMTTHINPHVVHAAFHALANIAEEPVSHPRLLALCPMEHIASGLQSFVQDALDVETLSSASSEAPDLSKGLARLFARLVNELCRMMANLADGGAPAMRSLKEAAATLAGAVKQMPGHIPKDVKWHLQACLARQDDKEPPPVTGLAATFESLVAAARDRIDNARVQKGVHALSTLCRDAENHQELVDAGAVDALVGVLRNPLPEIFTKACWALTYLGLGGERSSQDQDAGREHTAKDREKIAETRCLRAADLRKRMLADEGPGLNPLIRASIGEGIGGPRGLARESRNAASKLVSVLLRSPDMALCLERNNQPTACTEYNMPSF